MFCNTTDEAVSLTAKYPGCGLATEPNISYLAPKSCVVIDNSGSWFSGCWVTNIIFKSVTTGQIVAKLNEKQWGDYTFSLKTVPLGAEPYIIDVTAGSMLLRSGAIGYHVPPGSRVVAVLENMSQLVLGKAFKKLEEMGTRFTPSGQSFLENSVINRIENAFSPPEAPNLSGDMAGAVALVVGGAAVGITALLSGGLLTYDAYQALNECYRNGKYLVWIARADAEDASAIENLKNKDCDDRCKPNKEVIVIDPSTVCGYAITSNLAKKFSFLQTRNNIKS